MKRIGAWLLVLALALGCLSAAAEPTVIEPNMDLKLEESFYSDIPKLNPEVEGENPLTGLPAGEEAYTPIVLVLDDSPEVFPHWGVAEADWIVQVPLRRDGDTRMVAVYSSAYPEQAGGVRSARMTILPIATLFNAGIAYAGYPPNTGWDITVKYWLDEWDFNKPIRYFDVLGRKYKERVDFLEAPQNLSAHVNEMHQNLVKRKVKFQKRYFLFADEAETRGDDAKKIDMAFYGCEETLEPSIPSACSFAYTEGTGYLRDSSTGIYSDRNTGEAVPFANVVVMRTKINWDGYYPFYEDHLRYYGEADVFMNGKHISGYWYRRGRIARLVLLDKNGEEIRLQRGKTFMVVGDQYTVVSYE